jgi:hypothetical protein
MSKRFEFRQTNAAAVLALISLGLVTSAPWGAEAPAPSSSLVGTWRLIQYFDTDSRGNVSYPYGRKPIGYFVYDPTGHLSIQIMRTPATPPFASGSDQSGTNREVRDAYDGYMAYFGTYRIDQAKGVVIHVVEGSLRPSYTGTDQPRPFKLDGDTLIIGGPLEDGSSYYRELHRVK